ncbi:hypothetical protein NC653_022401 [Populus alba x Populus x berolinensis]|uniref:Uncharacterized protein n=1 Tax=Populus alba x Populus x berolinensis TaxID=444605 RepID=A0AAD6Q9F4_9ROSI|nr:hypothetical protein NC653_022401 [Populus alba x Populus x berolinensis]
MSTAGSQTYDSLNLGVSPKDSPSPAPTKYVYTSPGHISYDGPSETMAYLKLVIYSPLRFYTIAVMTTGTWEANRRRKKAKLPRVADSSESDGNKMLDSPSGTS